MMCLAFDLAWRAIKFFPTRLANAFDTGPVRAHFSTSILGPPFTLAGERAELVFVLSYRAWLAI